METAEGKTRLATIITTLLSVVPAFALVTGYLTYRLNVEEGNRSSEENLRKAKTDEITVLSKSIDCSLSHEGTVECAGLYTKSYPDGIYTKLAEQASASGKALSSCDNKKKAEQLYQAPSVVLQHGTTNQFSGPQKTDGGSSDSGNITHSRCGSINVTGGSVTGSKAQCGAGSDH